MEEDLRAMFDTIDSDNSGSIDRVELEDFLKFMGKDPLTVHQVEEAHSLVDHAGYGLQHGACSIV